MAIRHLIPIENLLQTYPNEWFTRVDIRDELQINYKTVIEALDYLQSTGKVKIKTEKNVVRYGWNDK